MTTLVGTLDSTGHRIRLDWREYYYEFVHKHGEPIINEGRLLFGDGWQYSSTSHQGPEYPPPNNSKELKRLRLIYWVRMVAKYFQELTALKNNLRAYRDWQDTKSMPLKQRIAYQSEGQEGLATLSKPEDIDFSILENRILDAEQLLNEATTILEEVDHG